MGGVLEIKGEMQLERCVYCMEYLDYFCEILMYELRGYYGMYGCIIILLVSVYVDFGVLFMYNEGWSMMCGYGIIVVIIVGIEIGMFEVIGEK